LSSGKINVQLTFDLTEQHLADPIFVQEEIVNETHPGSLA
jgi:hypothetical protein